MHTSLALLTKTHEVQLQANSSPMYFMCACPVAQPCPTLCDPTDCGSHWAPLSVGFSRQEYWSGVPFPSPGHLPNSGIEHKSPKSLSLVDGFFTAV